MYHALNNEHHSKSFFCVFELVEMPKYREYNSENVRAAVAAVEGGMSFRKAAKMYGIPKTTIHDRVAGRIALTTTRSGPPTILTPAEEDQLVNHIIKCGKVGYPLSKTDVKLVVKHILDEDKRPNPFPENKPGKCKHCISINIRDPLNLANVYFF